MIEIPVKDPTYEINGKHITKFEVSPINFIQFATIGTNATSMETTQVGIQRRMLRERIKAQVKAINGDGSSVSLDEVSLARIPVACALHIKTALSATLVNGGAEPTLLSDKEADGITQAIHIRLGTPIRYKEGATEREIWELEFIAKTLSDIEDVLVADNKLEQAKAMLALAKPVGPDIKLTTLPSWAVDQITMMDGLWLMSNAISPFLDADETS